MLSGSRRFWWAVLGVVVVAVGLRVGFAVEADRKLTLDSDAAVFHESAAHLADGDGLSVRNDDGTFRPMSEHPPAFPVALAGLDVVHLSSPLLQRLALAVVAGLGVALVALLGLRLGSERVGVVAAAIAAVHPLWIEPSGRLMSESLLLVVVPLFLLLALSVLRRPTWPLVVATGAVGGLLVLTRSETALLVVAVLLALLLLDRRPLARRLATVGAAAAAVLLVVVPWMGRNVAQADSFAVSTNLGSTLAGANCEETYGDGPGFGGWDLFCSFAATRRTLDAAPDGRPTRAQIDRVTRHEALTFASDHRSEIPAVAAARVARLWGVGHSGNQLEFDVAEGAHRTAQTIGQWCNWVLLPLAVAGAVVLPRRRWRTWVIVALPAVTATVSAALIYGSTRMRAAAEPTIALFAAVALVSVGARLAHRPTLAEEMDESEATGRQSGLDDPRPTAGPAQPER